MKLYKSMSKEELASLQISLREAYEYALMVEPRIK